LARPAAAGKVFLNRGSQVRILPGALEAGGLLVKGLRDIKLPDHERRAIEAASALLRALFPVRQVVLFGSKARGASDQESDIDLLVLTTRSLPWREQCLIIDALYPLQLEHKVVFSPLIVAADDWSAGLFQVLPIRKEIERDGVAA
jgi:predicted nucleotidyltransferase